MPELRGNIALISGGLGDIGRAIAVELAARGADIAIGDIAKGSVAAPFLSKLQGHGVRATYHEIDVVDADAVRRWVGDVEQSLGLPTIAIANAAQVTQATFQALTPEQWNRELRVNLDGAFHVAHAAVLRMITHRRPGRIVFVGSWAADRVHPAIPAYCVAKAGLRMLCRCMALECAPLGILVNEVAPGIVDAGLSARIMRDDPGLRDRIRSTTPVRELVSSQDVARAVAFLCDPRNTQMAGATLLQDGGMSLLPAQP